MASKNRCVLAVWLDGFRTDYLDKRWTPYIYGLKKDGTRGEYRPLLAFAGIGVSMVTGVGPPTHGVWTEFYYDGNNSPFKAVSKLNFLNTLIDTIAEGTGTMGHAMKTVASWSIIRMSGIASGNLYFPMAMQIPNRVLNFFSPTLRCDIFSEKAFPFPNLTDILLRHGIPFRILSESKMRDRQILARSLRVNRNAKLVIVQLSALDRLGHTYGPDSEEVHRSLCKLDCMVERIVSEHQKLFEVQVLVFSDHGMVKVKNLIDVASLLRDSGLEERKDFIVFLDSTLARFWTLNHKAADRISDLMSDLKGGRLLTPEDYSRYQIPNDQRYGQVIWLARPGNLILPNYYQGACPKKGMHGYAPDSGESFSPFVIFGKDIEPRSVKHTASPMDIFSTLLDLCHLPLPCYCEGRSLIRTP